MQVFDICPLPKPRMTQRDRWAKRPAVLRYRAFCDEVRLRAWRCPSAIRTSRLLCQCRAAGVRKNAKHRLASRISRNPTLTTCLRR